MKQPIFSDDAALVREQMNLFGRSRIPFLFAVDFEMAQGFVMKNPMQQDAVLFRTPSVRNYIKNESGYVSFSFVKQDSYQEYSRKFDIVMSGLRRGDSYVTNLTSRTEIYSINDPVEIFKKSSSLYGLYVPGKFLSYSPERFVKIDDGSIYSSPMKGTIDASLPDAGDAILNSYKEMCEHNAIVDLIRNDLGSVCKEVEVENFRYLSEVTTDRGAILQVSSDIVGVLRDELLFNFGDIIFSLLPAGSVSGAPKESTCKIIRNAETFARGFYTGVFGYFDGNVLDSAVLIRYIEIDGDNVAAYRSGGGITVNSICREEYEEMLKKIYIPK